VQTLTAADNLLVPRFRKNSLGFWWDAEMCRLKEESVNANRIRKSLGRPEGLALFFKGAGHVAPVIGNNHDETKMITQTFIQMHFMSLY
jgi:hypothetical protein